MKMNYNALLNETIYQEQLDNGLKIHYIPNSNFNTIYGLMSVNFGSNDLCDGDLFIPGGSAHFLEHQMFRRFNEQDFMDDFASLGVECNAYTTHYRTCYYFYGSSRLEESLKLLFDMVLSLEIDEESVESEKGIIIEEIHQEDDQPAEQAYNHATRNLYHVHPYINPICGNDETVMNMKKETLEKIFHCFYYPGNMHLYIGGPFDVNEISKVIHRYFSIHPYPYQPSFFHPMILEDQQVEKKEETLVLDTHTNYVSIACKIEVPTKEEDIYLVKSAYNMLFDLLFSKSSYYYQSLIKRKIINESFNYTYAYYYDFCFLVLELASENIELFIQEMRHLFASFNQLTFTDEDFEMIKRMNIGSVIANFNSPIDIVDAFVRDEIYDLDPLTLIDFYKEVTIEDVKNAMKKINEESISICRINKNVFTNDL